MELNITLGSSDDVETMLRAFEATVNCLDPKATSPLEELGVLLGNLNNEGDQIGNVSASDNVMHVEYYKGANLRQLRALCKSQKWKIRSR